MLCALDEHLVHRWPGQGRATSFCWVVAVPSSQTPGRFLFPNPLWLLRLHLSYPRNPQWVTSGLDLVVVSQTESCWLLPCLFWFSFLSFFISISQALVTQVMASASCEDAFPYTSSLPTCPQLLFGLIAMPMLAAGQRAKVCSQQAGCKGRAHH